MRSFSVGILSVTITSMVISYAYYQKKQFYPTVVYITKSNPSMAVMYIQAFLIVMLGGKIMKKLFFGELRPAEFEHLVERAWYAITETCLAFTVFKDDFSPKFVALFTLLLFLKCFHWLAEDRVDFMERSPVISWIFHIRIISLLSLLSVLDLFFIIVAYHWTVAKGASVHLVFGFEYAILFTIVFNISLKYVLHALDISREVFWENKAVFLLHMELFIGFVKVILYLLFVGLMIRLYTLPLFAFRPMYYTLRAFKKALHDVIMSRRAIRNMNTLYPDATAEELAAGDNVCIICREEMHTSSKKLPCNHIFHTSCLRSWFQRHQTCPTCRLNILRPAPDGQQTTPAAPAPEVPQNQPQQPPFGFPWQPFFLPFQMPVGNNMPENARGAAGQQQPQAGQSSQQQQQSSQQRQPLPEFQSSRFMNSIFTGSNRPNFSSNTFPFPFMFPPVPLIPGISNPPLPPQNFSGMSEEELRQMEDSSRRGVEARLQCLRNIQLLMDASVILMQQYVTSASVAANNVSSDGGTNNEPTASGSSNNDRDIPNTDTPSTSFPSELNAPNESDAQNTGLPGEPDITDPSSTKSDAQDTGCNRGIADSSFYERNDTSNHTSHQNLDKSAGDSSNNFNTSDASSSGMTSDKLEKLKFYSHSTSSTLDPLEGQSSSFNFGTTTSVYDRYIFPSSSSSSNPSSSELAQTKPDLTQASLSEREKIRRKRIEKLGKIKNDESSA